MQEFKLVQITHNKELEDGYVKQTTDTFIYDSVSFTDAETAAHRYAEQNIHGEFLVKDIKKTRISAVVAENQEHPFWQAKVVYSTVDGDSEKEKKINTYILVEAVDIEQAVLFVHNHLKEMLVPYEIPEIKLTKILEVIA